MTVGNQAPYLCFIGVDLRLIPGFKTFEKSVRF